MIHPNFFGPTLGAALALLVTALPMQNAKAQSAGQSMSADQRKQIEGVIHDYLIKNPTVIRDAMIALQRQEQEAKRLAAANALKTHRAALLSDKSSPVGGNPDGDVTIVEFFDYNCGYCKRVAPAVKEAIKKDPKIRIVYKEFAILGPQSVMAAKAALAADRQGKYLEFHNALMSGGRADKKSALALAKKLGLDVARLEKDMNDPEINKIIEGTYRLAQALNINGTPAFVIGDQVIPGAVDADALAQIVAAERAKKKAAPKPK